MTAAECVDVIMDGEIFDFWMKSMEECGWKMERHIIVELPVKGENNYKSWHEKDWTQKLRLQTSLL